MIGLNGGQHGVRHNRRAPLMSAAEPLTATRPRVPALSRPRVAARHWMALAVLALAGLSFLYPSAPTYDPWAWILWGREIAHLDLSTVDGPSWKPLPIFFTVPFSLFGGLAPDLWLFVARAGAIAGVVVVFRVARRLGGLPAGAAAAAAYGFAPWTIRNAAMGNSEGLLVALALGAADRHLAGRPRQAFLLGLGAALLRPEAWPLLGLYALWLFWRDRGARVMVAAGLASLPVLWLLPELWGSGDLLRAMHRAQNPNANSAAFADDPIAEVVRQFTSMLTPMIFAGLGAFVVLALVRRAPGRRELRAALAIGAAGALWVAEVAEMTNDGFSGNTRYLIVPAAIACVLAGVGVGWLVRGLGERLTLVVALAAAVAFVIPSMDRFDPVLHSLRYQADLTDGLAGAVDRAGGRGRLVGCGTPYTGPFQIPVVAWYLHVHTGQVRLDPRAPAVVFRAASRSGRRPGPPLDDIGGEAGVHTYAIANGWRIVGTCP
jgi:hypothetical protein